MTDDERIGLDAEYDRLRIDRPDLRTLAGQRQAPIDLANQRIVGRVTTPTVDIEVGKYLVVNPVKVIGTEAEGQAGTLSVDTSVSQSVYLIGPGTPAQGDDLICTRLTHRWVARRKGGDSPTTNTIIIHLTECGVGASGRMISLTNGITTFTQATDVSSNATFTGVPDGSWVASLPGDANWENTTLPPIVVSGGSSETREMNRSPKSGTCSYRLDLQFTGCNGLGFAGANVYLSGGGFSFSGVTDASGHWYLYLPPGSITWSLTHNIDVSRGTIQGNPTAYTFVGRPIFGGLSFTYAVNTASYHCIALECVFPVPNVLTVDTDTFGSDTYTWADFGPGNRTWYGALSGRLYVPSGDTVYPVPQYGVITSLSYTLVSCIPYMAVGTVTWGTGTVTNFTVYE